jgi:hypothetical protein
MPCTTDRSPVGLHWIWLLLLLLPLPSPPPPPLSLLPLLLLLLLLLLFLLLLLLLPLSPFLLLQLMSGNLQRSLLLQLLLHQLLLPISTAAAQVHLVRFYDHIQRQQQLTL